MVTHSSNRPQKTMRLTIKIRARISFYSELARQQEQYLNKLSHLLEVCPLGKLLCPSLITFLSPLHIALPLTGSNSFRFH